MMGVAMAFDINKIRQDFPNLSVSVRGKKLAYLDNAATTFKPRSVIESGNRHYSSGVANVHRGVHYLSEMATEEYEQARVKVRDFINASDVSEIIFTRGTTESINLVAHSFGRTFLKAGDEIHVETEIAKMFLPLALVKGVVRCGDKILSEGTLKLYGT